MKKNRIRIHKITLESLNHPKNIHLLINPTEYKIVIRPIPPNIKDSLQISYKPDSDCEFYSTELMEQLSMLNNNLCSDNTYRIKGEILEEGRLALFHINRAELYEDHINLETKN